LTGRAVTIEQRSPAVIWDLDGTLVRLDVPSEQVAQWRLDLATRFRSFGFDSPFRPLLPSLERAMDMASDVMLAEDISDFRAEIYSTLDRWEGEAVRRIDVVSHTAELLACWSDRSVPMALVTNNGPTAAGNAISSLASFFADRGFPEPNFVSICTRDPNTSAKPAVDGFRRAFRALAAAAPRPITDLISIGDGIADCQAAAALAPEIGIAVWSLTPSGDRLEWADIQPVNAADGGETEDLLAALGLSVP